MDKFKPAYMHERLIMTGESDKIYGKELEYEIHSYTRRRLG